MAAMSLSTAGLGLSSRTLSNNVVSLRQAAPARVQHAGFCVQAASKKKDVRLTITLECTEQKAAGVQGMSRYTTEKVSGHTHISAARSRDVLVASRRDFPGNRLHKK